MADEAAKIKAALALVKGRGFPPNAIAFAVEDENGVVFLLDRDEAVIAYMHRRVFDAFLAQTGCTVTPE